jgi:hypothetical protein
MDSTQAEIFEGVLDLVHTYIHTYVHTYKHTYTHTYIYTVISRYSTFLPHTPRYSKACQTSYKNTYMHTCMQTYIHTYVHTYKPIHCPSQVFNMDSTQAEVFEGVSDLVQSALEGRNVCIFTYGQSGSGKTHTMYGHTGDPDMWGIAPRCIRELYELIEGTKQTLEVEVSCSMIQLYNDELLDLLNSDSDSESKPKLDLKMDPRGIVTVRGATVHDASTFDDLYKLNMHGMEKRHVSATNMNATSSRSHVMFIVMIKVSERYSPAIHAFK